jgi:hypothetical protein
MSSTDKLSTGIMLMFLSLPAFLLASCGGPPPQATTPTPDRADGRTIVEPASSALLQNRWDTSGLYEFHPKLAPDYLCVVYRDLTAPTMACFKP